MMVNRLAVRFAISLSLTTLSACVCRTVCEKAPLTDIQFSGFSEETASLLKAREADFSQTIAQQEQVVIDHCCLLFTSTLAGRHCTPKINAYCEATYPGAAEREKCLNSSCRTRLLDRCLRDVYEDFKKSVPTCSHMSLGGTALDTSWTYPDHRTARCPEAAATPRP